MSTRRKSGPPMPAINPLLRIAAKGLVPPEFADKVALIVLLALDAAKRGQCNNAQANTLTLHLCAAKLLWARARNKAMWDRAAAGFDALFRAAGRDLDKPMTLTTGEYSTIRTAVSYYVQALPLLEVGKLAGATQHAAELLNEPAPMLHAA